MDGIIRRAEPKDQAALVGGVQAASSKDLERLETSPAPMRINSQALLAQDRLSGSAGETEMRGVLVMMPQGRRMCVEDMTVDPRFHGQERGRMFMVCVETAGQKRAVGMSFGSTPMKP